MEDTLTNKPTVFVISSFSKVMDDAFGTSEQPLSPRPAYDQAGEKRRDRVKWRNSH